MISVIVPVYNTIEYLRRCVESLLSQTYHEYEIILVDDGSTDGSGELCDQFAAQNTLIKVIHKANGGLSEARNRGIDEAGGEYLSFIDSDDFVHPRMLEILYDNLLKYDADISVCSFWWQKEDEQICDDVCVDAPAVFEGDAIMRQIFDNKVETIIACNKLYKRELFDHLRYAIGKLHEDVFIIHHLLYRCRRIVYSPCKLYYYMKHSGSITGQLNDKRVKDSLEALGQRALFLAEIKMIKESDETLSIWKRDVREKYMTCKEVKFEGYKKTQKWLRKEFRRQLPELKERKIITSRECLIQSVWTYCPACGTILEYIAVLKQRFVKAFRK